MTALQGLVSALSGRSVSRETQERLELLAHLVGKWNRAINLVAAGSLPQLWHRHIADSLQLFDVAGASRGDWLDLGSGGGFPGAVVAILAADEAPDMRVTLVESDQRKAAFLRTVSRETGVAFDVICERSEILQPKGADLVSARALAPLDRLFDYAERHLATHGMAFFPKGARYLDEVSAARARWAFDCVALPSRTDPAAAILKVRGIRRV